MYSSLQKSSLKNADNLRCFSKLAVTSKISPADVEANRRRTILVSKEKQEEIVGYIKSELHGLLTTEEFQDFQAYRSEFYKQLLSLESLKDMQELHLPLKNLMDYSVDVVASTGIILFLSLFKHYSENPTKEEMNDAYFYAWAQFITHGVHFPLDDFLDRTPTRRFKPAYYVEFGAELTTIQIVSVFHAISEAVVHKFSEKPYYKQLIRRWSYYNSLAAIGQLLDLHQQKSQEAIWNMPYRDEHNKAMASPAHDLPLEIAAIMTGTQVTLEDLDFWRSMMFVVHTLLRNTNDYNDVYPEAPTGKPLYMDIANGTPSWCSATAWQLANEDQRQVLSENYGFEDNEKIAKVIQVYEEINLRDHGRHNRKACAKEILNFFEQCPEHLAPKKLLLQLFQYATAKEGLAWS